MFFKEEKGFVFSICVSSVSGAESLSFSVKDVPSCDVITKCPPQAMCQAWQFGLHNSFSRIQKPSNLSSLALTILECL